MKKNEYMYIINLLSRAEYALDRNEENLSRELILTAREYCNFMADEIREKEDNERWLEEKRIQASIGTSNQ